MTWEGTLDNQGLVLSDAAIAAGWVMQIVGNELQVQNPNLPPAPVDVLLGDINRDGSVTFADIGPFIGLLSNQTFQAEGDFDGNSEVNFADIPGFIFALSS